MTQMTEPRSDKWHTDGAPPESADGTAHDAFWQHGDQPGGPDGSGGNPPHGGLHGSARREPRRPGWPGVAVLGVGAALLSSLLTAGAITTLDDRTATTAPAASSTSTQQSAPLVAGSSTTTPDWGSVATAVEPSVVSVRVQAADGTGDEGSGVVLDTSGHVLTNNHVIAGAGSSSISVVLSDGSTYAATVTGADVSTDLAVLQLKSPPSGLKAATFGASSSVKVGDPVMAIGNPLGLSETVTTGIVSALHRPVTATTSSQQLGTQQTQQVVTDAIQTDAAVNPGNSGGALVDSGGRVIGITSSIASLGSSSGSSQSGSIGLGFAIPADEAKQVASQLINTGTVQHAYLGVGLTDGTVTVAGAQRQAALIGTVSPGTPAAAAGLQARDSVIAINGQTLDGADSLVAQISAHQPGTKVTLTVVRDGLSRSVSVTLAARPAGNG
jgi:putative serine protease PepD